MDKIDNFNQKVKSLFHSSLEAYGYGLEKITTGEINGHKWSTHHIYINTNAQLKIEIIQAPYNADYGFSFFIYKLGTDQSNILYNVPHENQDKEDGYLNKAYEELFSTQEAIDLISGKYWKQLGYILFQK